MASDSMRSTVLPGISKRPQSWPEMATRPVSVFTGSRAASPPQRGHAIFTQIHFYVCAFHHRLPSELSPNCQSPSLRGGVRTCLSTSAFPHQSLNRGIPRNFNGHQIAFVESEEVLCIPTPVSPRTTFSGATG